MRFPRFIIGLTAGIALSAQAANIDEYINQLPAGANLAFMAQKVGASTPEIDYHSQQMALPASTQKVITALAALLQLGPDFRFTTTLETKGSLDGGVLKGDLIARFGGDPTLKRQDIRNMVATLKKAGVPVFAYGSFITILINFIILAFIIFMLVKVMNRLRRQTEAEAPAAAEPSEEILLLREISSKLGK